MTTYDAIKSMAQNLYSQWVGSDRCNEREEVKTNATLIGGFFVYNGGIALHTKNPASRPRINPPIRASNI